MKRKHFANEKERNSQKLKNLELFFNRATLVRFHKTSLYLINFFSKLI
jgi:hypothetical protein